MSRASSRRGAAPRAPRQDSAVDLRALLASRSARAALGLLGEGGALWTPTLSTGFERSHHPARRWTAAARAPRPTARRTWLVLAQAGAVAERTARAAAAHRLCLVAALCPGDRARWIDWAETAPALSPQPTLLVALTQPVPIGDLIRLAAACPGCLLMCPDVGTELLDWPTPPAPPVRAVARALGLVAVSTPEELAGSAALLEHGLAPASGRLLALATSADEARLADDALRRHGLALAPPPAALASAPRIGQVTIVAGVPSAVVLARRAPALGMDAVLVNDRLILPAGETIAATADALAALAALLAWPERCPPRRPSIQSRRACQLLDRWPAALGEVQVKQLLACYGLAAPVEQLVTSASAAGRAAARIGFPVAVKAAGPTLSGRLLLGAIALPVPNASACRQAFRDVLLACQRLPTPQPLDGVLVSALVSLPFALDATLAWLAAPTPPLLILSRRELGAAASPGVVLTCPTPAAHAERAAERLLGPRCGPAELRGLADLVVRLSWIGPDLAGRMVWLRVDTISPPDGGQPALVIDARALQTEGQRAPPFA